MMVPGNDPLDSFFNSFQFVKSPLESNFRKLVKDFKNCFDGVVKNVKLISDCSNVELVAAQLNVNKKKSGQHVVISGVDRENGKFRIEVLFGMYKEKCGGNDHDSFNFIRNGVDNLKVRMSKKGLKDTTLKTEQKGFRNTSNGDISCSDDFRVEVKQRASGEIMWKELLKIKPEKRDLSFEYLKGFIFDRLSHFPNEFDQFKAFFSVLGGKREDVNGFLTNLKFAQVGGVHSSGVEVRPEKDIEEEGIISVVDEENRGENSRKELANGMAGVSLSSVERLRSTFSTISLSDLIELLPRIGRLSEEDHCGKSKLFSVQDFFRYTQAEGKRFFQELDRDSDGKVTLHDLEIALRKRQLPKRYAHELMRRTKTHLFSTSFGWKQFSSLMEEKEPTILRAYTSLCLRKKPGTFRKSEVVATLENAGHGANEDNAVAVMRFLNADANESISYGRFRDFMLLLPSDERIGSAAGANPLKTPADGVLKSALAGGLSCALSASIMHPVDTVKTWVQASTLTFPEVISKLPQFGVRALYRGSIPAILGQFSSHGLRTGICEASKLVLVNVAPTLPEMQVESVASFCGTFLGTAMRIPCEVLKQRLQAGLFDNVGQAIVGTWKQDGLSGFFRGTGATLCREIPFYVAGMGLYAESKKAAQRLIGRELQPWETVAVGALSGGLTAVMTTPIDVIKTRMMVATQGQSTTLSVIILSILAQEGPIGLFKGAVPRFFWVSPLGAMNFAGYELLRKAMD